MLFFLGIFLAYIRSRSRVKRNSLDHKISNLYIQHLQGHPVYPESGKRKKDSLIDVEGFEAVPCDSG